jgi:hypothetical protein
MGLGSRSATRSTRGLRMTASEVLSWKAHPKPIPARTSELEVPLDPFVLASVAVD